MSKIYNQDDYLMYSIHVFLLSKSDVSEDDRFFVYMSLYKSTIDETKRQCELLHDLNIDQHIEVVETDDFSEVDHVVKIYMSRYGIDNVRGGTYSADVLPEYMKQTLMEEMKYIQSGPFSSLILTEELGHFIRTLEKKSNWSDPKNMAAERLAIERRLANYHQESELYSNTRYFSMGGKQFAIDDTMLNDIQWIDDLISMKYSVMGSRLVTAISGPSPTRLQKYRNILIRLKRLAEIYFTIRETIDYEHVIHFTNPEFVFDRFVCHFSKEVVMTDGIQWKTLCNKFTYMFYCVKNHLDCLEFDVNSYGEFIEETSAIKLRYLDTVCCI